MTFYAVIPAGGAGTRLWPLSRQGSPKFLHDLTGTGRSLLQATVDRLTPLAQQVLVVTGQAHAPAVAVQLPGLDTDQILHEPSPRDSMAAIGLAAAVLLVRHPEQDVVIGSFAADHVITGSTEYADALTSAVAAARAGYVATIGIEATGPSTGFGYIEMGEELTGIDAPIAPRQVRGFTEKPDGETAAAFLASGRYRWNAGMFVVRARVLMDHLAIQHPDLAAGLGEIAAVFDTGAREETLGRIWPELTKIAIDHAIAEPVAAEGGVAVVPATFGWDDVGDWASVAGLLPAGADGVRVLGDAERVTTRDAPGAVLSPGSGRRVVVLGIPDAVVVDTGDVVLVTTTDRAQEIKDVVAALREEGSEHLL